MAKLVKILIGMAVAIFILLWLMIPYIIEKPVVTVDYFTQYNDLTRPDNYSEEDNAAILLEDLPLPESEDDMGFESTLDTPDFLWSYEPYDYPDKFKPDEIEQFKNWIKQYEPTFEALAEIVQKPYYYRPVDPSLYRSELLQNQIYSHYNNMDLSLYELQEVMQWTVMYHLIEGNHIKAIETAKSMLAYHQLLEKSGGVYQYYQFATLIDASELLMSTIQKLDTLSPETLMTLQQIFSEATHPTHNNYAVQRLFFMDYVQKMFTKGDQGHLSAAAMIKEDVYFMDFSDTFTILSIIYQSVRCERRKNTVDRMEAVFEKLEECQGKSLFELHQQGVNMDEEIRAMAGKNVVVKEQAELLLNSLHQPKRLACKMHATAAIIAIVRFYRNKGHYPESLETLLTEGYMEKLPTDIYSGKPLIYRKEKKDFILYSVGVDYEDDGGRYSLCPNCGDHQTDWGDGPVSPDTSPNPQHPADREKDAKGDHIFWPNPDAATTSLSPFTLTDTDGGIELF